MAIERVDMNRPVRSVRPEMGHVAVFGFGDAYSDRYGSGASGSAGVDWKIRARLEASGVPVPEPIKVEFSVERSGRKWLAREEEGGRGEVFIADRLRDVALAARESAVSRYVPGLEAALVRFVPEDRMLLLAVAGGV